MDTPKLICPHCGAEMNCHAIKIEYDEVDQTLTDPDFGGVLEEVHTCPRCGLVMLRPVPGANLSSSQR